MAFDGLFTGAMTPQEKKALIGLLGLQVGGSILAANDGRSTGEAVGAGLLSGTDFLGKQNKAMERRRAGEQQREINDLRKQQIEAKLRRQKSIQEALQGSTPSQALENAAGQGLFGPRADTAAQIGQPSGLFAGVPEKARASLSMMDPDRAVSLIARSQLKGNRKAPTTRKVERGGREVWEEWTGEGWKEVGSAKGGASKLTATQEASATNVRNARVVMQSVEQQAAAQGVTVQEYIRKNTTRTDPMTGLPVTDYSSDLHRMARMAAKAVPGEGVETSRKLSMKFFGRAAPPEEKAPAKGKEQSAAPKAGDKISAGGKQLTVESVNPDGTIVATDGSKRYRLGR